MEAIQSQVPGLPRFRVEHPFNVNRKWRFDFSFECCLVAVEIDGGVFSGGRHTRGQGYINDMEKLNTAEIFGWHVLKFTPSQFNSDYAVETLSAYFSRNPCKHKRATL